MKIKKTFLKIILTYIVYMFLILAIFIIVYYKNIDYWETREVTNYEQDLEKKALEFRKQIFNVAILCDRIGNDSRYQTIYTMKEEPTNKDYVLAERARQDFSYFITTNSMVNDAGVYFTNRCILTYARTFIKNDTYKQDYERFFCIEGMSTEEWLQLLENNKGIHIYSDMKVKTSESGSFDSIVIVDSILDSSKNIGSLYNVIPVSDIVEFFIPQNMIEEGYLYMTDYEGQVYVDYQYQQFGDNDSYYTVVYTDSLLGIDYKMGVPRQYVIVLLRPFQQAVSLYMIFFVIGGIILAIIFSFGNTRPVRKLVKKANSMSENLNIDSMVLSEYEYVEMVMGKLQHSTAEMTAKLNSQKIETRRMYLDKALNGKLTSSNSISQFLDLFPEFPDTYRLILIWIKDEIEESIEMQLSRQLLMQDALLRFWKNPIMVTLTNMNTWVFVIPAEGMNPHELQIELKNYLDIEYNMEASVVCSDESSDILEMPALYTNALCNFTEVVNKETDTGRGIEKLRRESWQGGLPDYICLQRFFEACNIGEQEIALSVLLKIKEEIIASEMSFSTQEIGEIVYRSMHTSILKDLCNILIQVKLNNFHILRDVHIPIVTDLIDKEFFFDEIIECMMSICKKINENKLIHNKNGKIEKIMSFINDSIGDVNLSVTMVAEVFQISGNTLQKYIRQMTGKTFLEYVEDKRVNQAHHLLRTTNMSVDEVAVACGFSSYNSMYKVFKRKYNVSPRGINKL